MLPVDPHAVQIDFAQVQTADFAAAQVGIANLQSFCREPVKLAVVELCAAQDGMIEDSMAEAVAGQVAPGQVRSREVRVREIAVDQCPFGKFDAAREFLYRCHLARGQTLTLASNHVYLMQQGPVQLAHRQVTVFEGCQPQVGKPQTAAGFLLLVEENRTSEDRLAQRG